MPTLKKVYTESYRSGFYHPTAIIILAVITISFALIFYINSKYLLKPPQPTPPAQVSPIPSASPKQSSKIEASLEVISEFTDSKGVNKFIISERVGWVDQKYINNIYLSQNKNNISSGIKIKDIKGWDIREKPLISRKTGKQYFIIWLGAGDSQDFIISDEDGKTTTLDKSKIGLGTLVKPMFGLKQGNWITNTNNFTIIAMSGDAHTYEAIFDATTGNQIGETKQLD